ncbi:unnamed protein product [Adineta steineri]|uniref:Uncharacterized protein n=1 Tax=Adineta steineri TaxID=433720 RepID=A0A814UXT1_9BILA|nr:unnamed protein product [Adineta steineri]CAF3783501.1 unnamed protein product [Adineta steineri]
MTSITNHSNKQDQIEDSKSNSIIQLEFRESVAQILAATSYRQYSSRKRSASKDTQRTYDKEENTNKKQRNNNDYHVFQTQKQNEMISKRLISTQNITENNLEWFQDFMLQYLVTLRDTVTQACITAISSQFITPLNSNTPTQDININNYRTGYIQSEHSLTLHNRLDDEDDYIGKKQRIHHRARLNPYPMFKNIFRTQLNDIQVPWSYEWPQYKPIIFTAEEVYNNPDADPDLLKSPSSISLHFNTIDGTIDRRSVYHHYHINKYNGLPLNPIGRTGIQGRGILLRWGPNIYHYIIICRWKRDIQGRIILHPSNGKKILEILLEIQTDGYETNDFILTGGLHVLGYRFPPQLQDRLKRFIIHAGVIFNNEKKISSSLIGLNHLFEQTPIPWKGAYFDDTRNTDNAWIELSIEYLLDYDHQLTTCIPCLHNEQLSRLEQPRFLWKDVKNTINIGPRTHYRLIRNLAYKLDAYF